MYLLTIVIPSYNHEKFIINCLNSVSLIPIKKKVIIIDDGSNDNSVNLIKQFIQDHDFNEEYSLIQKLNSGLISSLNIGIELLTTKYCYFIASDDVVNPRAFFQLFSILDKSDDLDFIIGGALNIFESGENSKVYNNRHHFFLNNINYKTIKNIFFQYPHPILIQSTIFKSEFINKIGRWDEEVKLDDYPLWIKIFLYNIKHDKKILFKPELLLVNYMHHNNNSYKNIIRQHDLVSQTLEFYCPSEYVNSALGQNLANYFLMSIKNKQLNASLFLLLKIKLNLLLYFIWYLFKLPFKRIFN